jgi:hypothetical protein
MAARMAAIIENTGVHKNSIYSSEQSPLTESNRRPSPYHGDALPTELRGPAALRISPAAFPPRQPSIHDGRPARSCQPTWAGTGTPRLQPYARRASRGSSTARIGGGFVRAAGATRPCSQGRPRGPREPEDCGNTRNLVPWPHNGRASGHEPTSADRSLSRTQQPT